MGLLDSLLGNNARKFIKRKDSDAGEAGSDLQTKWILFVCVCVMAPFYSLTLYEFSLHWNDKIVFIYIWISILS